MITTRLPERCNVIAAAQPAGPAPTMRTSTDCSAPDSDSVAGGVRDIARRLEGLGFWAEARTNLSWFYWPHQNVDR